MSRVVFFGSPDFAVPSLRAISETEFRPRLVVTQPDRPSGRGRKMAPTPVRRVAEELGLPVRVMESFRDEEALQVLGAIESDFFVVAAFGLIFPKRALELPSVSCINVHASLLPRWRGASPVNRAITAGDACTGVTTMKMVKGLDAGPIFLQRSVRIEPMETAGELADRLSGEGADLLVETLRRIEEDGLQPSPQPEEGVTLAPLLRKSDGLIPWDMDPVSVHNHIRGMNPWPGSHTYAGDMLIKVHGSRPIDLEERTAPAGTVLRAAGGSLEVACEVGSIGLTLLQTGGRKVMPAGDFLRGCRIEEGTVLGGRTDE